MPGPSKRRNGHASAGMPDTGAAADARLGLPSAPDHREVHARSAPRLPRLALLLLGGVLASANASGAAGPAPATKAPAAKVPGAAPAPAQTVRLSAATVPATGTRHVDVEVARFGRYALTAKSAQGTAVQLVDRMAGPGEIHGEPGRQDGRVDAFLERGTYRLRTHADPAGTGEARVDARPFVEVSPGPVLLPDQAAVTTTLADLEQRSWWVQVEADQDFAVELAGRSLGDVRLWRDGQWLDPATPECEEIAPDTKRPLRRCALTTRLGAGLWQLVAYGGPAVPWSLSEGDQPLHVRRGIPTLAEVGRLAGEIGPFGTERWLVPRAATLFRLELPSASDASVSVRTLDVADPFRRDGTVGRIQKESLPPAAEVYASGGDGARVVTVSGAVGQAFVLQHFGQSARTFELRGSGPTYLTTLHAGDPLDRADVTGVLVEAKSGAAPTATSLIPVGPAAPYRRKFNVLGETTISFDVAAEGTYQVALAAPGVKWRWEPLVITKPKGYEAPAFREGLGTTELGVGRWTLTLLPEKPGIVDVVVRRDPMQKVEPRAPHANLQMIADLDRTKRYTVVLNQDDGAVGFLARPLPADLAQPLPVTVPPGESLTVPVVVAAPGALVAPGLEIALGTGAPAPRAKVAAGTYTVTLTNPGTTVVQAALGLSREDRGPKAPLPPLPDTAVTTPPALPLLTAAAPRALDLAADASATFRLDVTAPGLYRVESTGLLATAGAVRTRTRPVLASGAVNGVGRNFLVQTYLREGDYQVTVGAQGSSAGHLGVRVTPTVLRDGGALRDGVPARATVPAGEGVAYHIDVKEAGEHVIRAFGMGRLFRVRLEDADGWPLLAPEVDGDLRLDLAVGAYRLVVLPDQVDTTRLTTFDRVPEAVARTGHGPFPLALDVPAGHVWWDAAEGAERVPDTWTFTLDAAADVTVAVDGEMTGELVPAGAGEVIRLVPGRAWAGRLPAGEWRLQLVNARRNSGVRYTVRVTPRELVAGLSREVTLPASLAVSAGGAQLYEIASMGLVDATARLFDGAGNVVARSDDRPDDWNFRLLSRLAPGAYTLRVEPVGTAGGRTVVTMGRVPETDEAPLAVGQARAVTPGGGVVRVPIEGLGEGVFVATARSAENVGLVVEVRDGAGWRALVEDEGTAPRVVARVGAGEGAAAELRLRVASLDGRGLPATVRADLLKPRVVSESAFAGGVNVPVSAGAGVAVLRLARDAPGAIDLASRMGVSWCPAPTASPGARTAPAATACEPVPDTLLAAPDADVWLVAEATKSASFRGSRWTLADAPGRVTVTPERFATLDLRGAAGPVLVFAEAEGARPGVVFADPDGAPASASSLQGAVGGMDGDARRAVAYRPEPLQAISLDDRAPKRRPAPDAGVARIYTAEAATEPVEVTLTRVSFDTVEIGRLGVASRESAPPKPPAGSDATPGPVALLGEPPPAGAAQGTLAPGAGWRARLPKAPSRVRLVLGEGLVAVLSRLHAPTDTIWASDGPRDLTLDTAADLVTILNPSRREVAWSVMATPAEAPKVLRAGAPLEVRGGPAGRTRVAIQAEAPDTLHVRGVGVHARAVSEQGSVTTGRDLLVGSGRVEIVHGAGPWVAWVGSADGVPADEGAPGLWGRVEPDRPRTVATPAVVPLTGEAQAIAFAVAPGVVRANLGQSMVVRAALGGVERVLLALDGTLELPVTTEGRIVLTVRPLGGGELHGAATLELHAATPLAEGLGAEVLLGAGDARAWTFTLDADRPVGLGLRTASPDLAVTLHGPDGRVGEGTVQMPSLKAGTYLVVASLGPAAAPATVRPALVGLDAPDTGPPAEVIRRYLVDAGLFPADAPPVTE